MSDQAAFWRDRPTLVTGASGLVGGWLVRRLVVRDYFYVEDGAACYTLLAERLASRPDLAGRAYNFAVEGRVTVLDLVPRVLGLMGSDLEPA